MQIFKNLCIVFHVMVFHEFLKILNMYNFQNFFAKANVLIPFPRISWSAFVFTNNYSRPSCTCQPTVSGSHVHKSHSHLHSWMNGLSILCVYTNLWVLLYAFNVLVSVPNKISSAAAFFGQSFSTCRDYIRSSIWCTPRMKPILRWQGKCILTLHIKK